MNDMTILIVGIVVFGLMLTAVVMTVLEFQQLSDQEDARADSKPGGSRPRVSSNNRD